LGVCYTTPGQEEEVLPKEPFFSRMGKKQDPNPGFQKSKACPVHASSWKNPIRDCPGEKRGPEELADVQQSPCPSSGVVCLDEQEAK